MTPPDWLNEIVRAFGRQMGLKTLALNAAGTAGLRFEDGRELRLEYAGAELAMLVTAPAPAEDGFVPRLLALAHPDARRAVKIRTGLLAEGRRAFFHARLAERAVAVDALERIFRELWSAADTARRNA